MQSILEISLKTVIAMIKILFLLLENYCEVLYELSLINPASERIYKNKIN